MSGLKVIYHDPPEGSGECEWGFEIHRDDAVIATGVGFATPESRREAADIAWRRVQHLPPIPSWERRARPC